MDDSCIHVLLVEDNPGDAFQVEHFLNLTLLNQFHLIHVEQLKAAAYRLVEENFDIILLDLGLPDSLGLEALTAIKTQVPHIPVVILTGLGDEELAFQAVRQGAQDYLVKGQVTAEVLVRTIRYAIERKRTEETLKQAKAAAEAGNRAKSQFLASMSHEFRTPLNVMLGFTQILHQDCSLSPQQQEYLNIIFRSGEHLLTLINDILDMSKIEAGKTQVNLNHFDLDDLLNGLENMFQQRAQLQGLQLIIERALDIPKYVQTDESKLRQVLINLLDNAVKFTQQGWVALRVKSLYPIPHNPHSTPRTLHFEVEDTGPGVAPTELENLFDAFVQTQIGREMGQGTGLGLAISQQLVRLLGGEITVTSTLGQGSRFQFEIPVQLSSSSESYIYENSIEPDKTSVPARSLKSLPTEAVIESLATMPTKWLAAFDEAAVVAKAEPIYQLIDQIPQNQTALAETLVELVEDFRCDQIQNLVQQTGKLTSSR
ncbi:MAG: ATP-binding protein [Leptolyngbyaceae cyanobacterium MO_188.B28]|nr:ATP-binding protein [Leptolyngbyaceae cyanobacterium MO_188.B28]